jgi:S-DNA-T family DNA segregation ATPase FtsK/SpoIIIE
MKLLIHTTRISAVVPDCRSRIVPKGGMELGAGTPLFGAFSHATDTTVDMLRSLMTVMHARANRLRGHSRLHTPTRTEPLLVLIIDEIAPLTTRFTPPRGYSTESEHNVIDGADEVEP